MFAPQSPFARKVRIVSIETGMHNQIKPEVVTMIPGKQSDKNSANQIPLQKTPALILDNGIVLFDSRVICEYLVGLGKQNDLIPIELNERAQVMTLHALADGMCDAAVSLRYETWLRPKSYRWKKWKDAQCAKIQAGITWVEENPNCLSGPLNLAHVALASCLGYINFRWPEAEWLVSTHSLASWYEAIENRPSFYYTRPTIAA
nr:glutathione S-transferase family protein [Ruegeria atlantica]